MSEFASVCFYPVLLILLLVLVLFVGELAFVELPRNPITLPLLVIIGGYLAILISISCSNT